jgi:hypothetical protein
MYQSSVLKDVIGSLTDEALFVLGNNPVSNVSYAVEAEIEKRNTPEPREMDPQQTFEFCLSQTFRPYFYQDQSKNEDASPYEVDEPLPEWACGKADPDNIRIGYTFPTKDGRVTGNATLFDIAYKVDEDQVIFSLVTDANNILRLTPKELNELFHPPVWISIDYPNPRSNDTVEDELSIY